MQPGRPQPAGVHRLVVAALFAGIGLFLAGVASAVVDRRQEERAGWRVFALLYGVSDIEDLSAGHGEAEAGSGCPATRPGECTRPEVVDHPARSDPARARGREATAAGEVPKAPGGAAPLAMGSLVPELAGSGNHESRGSTRGSSGTCERRRELAWSAFLLKGRRRTVLFDTGFDDPVMARRWHVRGFRRVTGIIRSIGVDPEDVTDVVLSHLHWDHAGNVAPFTRARVWLRRAEYDWARSLVAPQRFARHGVHWSDVEVLQSIERKRQLELVGDRDLAIAPGLRLHLGGLHSRGDQWLEVRVGGTTGTVVLVGDDEASFASLTREAADEARAALRARMAELAGGEDHVIMSHDIATWRRFPEVADRVVEIR